MKIEIIHNDKNLIDQVVNLGTKNSKTLGHFPEGAYIQHAQRGFLFCAHENDQLLGYLLFSITHSKSSIRVIQLCLDEKARKKGIAKALLDSLKSKYRDSFKGIALSCRTDYSQATALWEKYGFKARNKVRSRSKKENWLFKWWFDFGNHDLFSSIQASSNKLKAVLDANIIIKLRSKSNEQTGTQYLLEDWLVDVIDYYYSPEIFNEIKRDSNDERAKKTRSFLSNFFEAKFDPDIRDRILSQLNQIISGRSINDLSDKKQLAECIASDIPYFITTDKKILDANDELNEVFGIQTLRPIDIILLVDENNNKSDYLSSRIAGVNYNYSNLKTGEIDELVDNILANDRNEKKHELRSILTRSAANIKNCKARVVRDGYEKILGAMICDLKHNLVLIPLLRTARTKLSKTLFTQLVFEAIEFAVSHQKNNISICDEFIEIENQETLESMGFIFKDGFWNKISAQGVIHSSELFNISGVDHLFDQNTLKDRLVSKEYNAFRISLERKLWPLKFNNLDIPGYIVPIKPHWASELFDHYAANNSMFGAQASLAWSRENAYYRNIKPVSEKVPARLLWYSSTTKDRGATRVNSIVGCSYLDEVHIGTAKELFRRFRHYGIYEWKNILELAKGNADNPIKALRFRDTEVFKNPVSFKIVNEILQLNGRKRNTFTGPLEITNKIFVEVYKLGNN
jgi:predicted nucleic acid-binding protein/GNAT superfamily N-acetyltransferase